MSHFVFGKISFSPSGPEIEQSICLEIGACCLSSVIFARIGPKEVPGIAMEMIGELEIDRELPFMLTMERGSDNSDSLVSPFVGTGIENTLSGLRKISFWLQCVLKSDNVQKVSLWLTEGWDDGFEELDFDGQSLDLALGSRIMDECILPSIVISANGRRAGANPPLPPFPRFARGS